MKKTTEFNYSLSELAKILNSLEESDECPPIDKSKYSYKIKFITSLKSNPNPIYGGITEYISGIKLIREFKE